MPRRIFVTEAVAVAVLHISAAIATVPGSATPSNVASVLGATHWSPCYFVDAQLPSLWDGASALAATGTKSIKLNANNAPDTTYPWNTDWASIMKNVTTLGELIATPIYDTALAGRSDPSGSWNYTTIALVSYSFGGGDGSGNYWCNAFTPADAAVETAEFGNLTLHLMSRFAGSGKRFLLEHWEGDWSARCGSYDPNTRADPAVQARMVQWLAARQAGVDAGRVAWCERVRPVGAGGAAIDCSDARATHTAAGVEVLHGSEVNLVVASMQTGFPNNILEVIPRVQLDIVSYSSYDSQALNPGFTDALDFIEAHHNRTALAQGMYPSIFVAEFGVAQNEAPESELLAVYANVVAGTFSVGPTGQPRAMAAFAWELFDNEVRSGVPGFPGQRCSAATGPQFNASDLNGFWLVRPDGSRSPSFSYIAGVVNGTIPVPSPPPLPSVPCEYQPDTDVQNPSDGWVVQAATQGDCCAACRSDVRCTAAVFAGGKCYAKVGGTSVPKPGSVACVPVPAE